MGGFGRVEVNECELVVVYLDCDGFIKKLDGIGSQRFVSIPVNKMADNNAGTSQKERVDDSKRIGSDGGWKIMVQVAN